MYNVPDIKSTVDFEKDAPRLDNVGFWWRASKYAARGDYVHPEPGATVERYNPWSGWGAAPGKGGGALRRPYLDLIDLVDRRRGLHRNQTADRSDEALVGWFQEHGPLGLLTHRLQQATMHPRWRLWPDGAAATQETFVRRPSGWAVRRTRCGNAGSRDADAEVGALVPQDLLRDQEQAEAIIRREDGTFARATIAATFGPYFAAVGTDPEHFDYPAPFNREDRFFAMYGEGILDFLKYAEWFADAVRAASTARPFDQMEETSLAWLRRHRDRLNGFAQQTNLVINPRQDGTFGAEWVSTSLLSSYATMAILDAEAGRLLLCDNCTKVFASASGRSRFCSPNCRNAFQRREWRAKKKDRA